MNNKQAIEELKTIKQNHIDLNYRFRHLYDDYIIALDIAIASLEAWDKVKEEISSRRIIKNYTENYDKSACDIYLSGFKDGLESALDIIEEHLKEIEE